MKKTLLLLGMISFFFAINSCDKTKKEVPPVQVNAQLAKILKDKGFDFDANGILIINDKVKNASTLDLSKTMITDFSGLSLFPKLTELNLQENGYGPIFDVSTLPANITSVDLTKNDICEFKGLAERNLATGNIKILHNFKKLYLPATAKYDCDQLVAFYLKDAKVADMKMLNENGELKEYNTLRPVNDEIKDKLKELFAELFVSNDGKDFIDISKVLVDNSSTGFYIGDKENKEGVEYIINNPSYKGEFISLAIEEVKNKSGKKYNVGYIKIPKTIKIFLLAGADTPYGLNLENAEGLSKIIIGDNDCIKKLDLSKSKFLGQRDRSEEFKLGQGSDVTIEACKNLEEVVFPKTMRYLWHADFIELPKLKELDLSFLEQIDVFKFGLLNNTKVKFPLELKHFVGEENDRRTIQLFITKDVVKNNPSVLEFIKKYKSSLTTMAGKGFHFNRSLDNSKVINEEYDFTKEQ